MSSVESIELDNRRRTIARDTQKLVEKYRRIFDWDVPDIDQGVADRLILAEMRKAFDEVERKLLR
jgi:hypothetical protein